MVKGGEQQVLSVTQSYKASIWCLCFIKNLFFFSVLSLTKPPWRTKLTNTPPRWNLEKLDMRDQMLIISPVVGTFLFLFLNQINVKGNDILITGTLIRQRVFSQCLPTTRPVENQPRAETEAVWEAGAACKVRFLWPRTSKRCWELLIYRSAEAFSVRSCVSMLATNSGPPPPSWEADPSGRHLAEAMGELRRTRPTPPSCGGKSFRRMLRFGASTPRYPTVTSRS